MWFVALNTQGWCVIVGVVGTSASIHTFGSSIRQGIVNTETKQGVNMRVDESCVLQKYLRTGKHDAVSTPKQR